MSYYLNPNNVGISTVICESDGISLTLKFNRAYPKTRTNSIAYNIYYSNLPNEYYNNKYFDINQPQFIYTGTNNYVKLDIFDPGETYYFAVRALEYNPLTTNLNIPNVISSNLYQYPQSLLYSDIDQSSTTITLIDASGFPSSGYCKIGYELCSYTSNDGYSLGGVTRGVLGSNIYIHNVDGYDGYSKLNPYVHLYIGEEEQNTRVFECQSRFDYPQFSYNETDGYHQKTLDINTDLSINETVTEQYPHYDNSGWRRGDPVALLNGECVGSYIGGERGCVDGYESSGLVRGLNLNEESNARQEVLLSVTGEPVVLLKMRYTGITCNCYLPTSQYPDDRCPICFGGGIILSYEQYYNPDRSDGRILIRVDSSQETIKQQEAGLESEFTLNGWTLTKPTIKQRDIIIRFDPADNEEYRYEVVNVTRNRLLNKFMGAQKFTLQRIRKTDVAYQVKTFNNTSYFPELVITSVSSIPGMQPHTHTIKKNENGTMPQLTSVSAGHSHRLEFDNLNNPIIIDELGHGHTIII